MWKTCFGRNSKKKDFFFPLLFLFLISTDFFPKALKVTAQTAWFSLCPKGSTHWNAKSSVRKDVLILLSWFSKPHCWHCCANWINHSLLLIILSRVTIMASILLKKLCFSAKFLAWGWASYSFPLLLSNYFLSPNLAMLWEQLYLPLLTDTPPDKQHYPRIEAERRGAVQLNETPTLGYVALRK